jgi:hypothetical protein
MFAFRPNCYRLGSKVLQPLRPHSLKRDALTRHDTCLTHGGRTVSGSCARLVVGFYRPTQVCFNSCGRIRAHLARDALTGKQDTAMPPEGHTACSAAQSSFVLTVTGQPKGLSTFAVAEPLSHKGEAQCVNATRRPATPADGVLACQVRGAFLSNYCRSTPKVFQPLRPKSALSAASMR